MVCTFFADKGFVYNIWFAVAITLKVQYTDEYPEEIPNIQIRIEKGLEDHQKEELLSIAQSTVCVSSVAISCSTVFEFVAAG